MEWKNIKIGDICKIKHGYAFKGVHFVDDPQRYVCVTPGNFGMKGGFKNDKPKYYNGPIPSDYILKEDDLIVTMTDLSKDGDTLGYSALVPNDNKYIFLHNQRIGLVQDILPIIDKHFLYWVMRTYDYQKYIVNHCSGSTVKHTSPSSIGSYNFKYPALSVQHTIAKILDNIENKISNNSRINANLEAQAQALYKSWFVDFEPWGGVMPEDWKEGKLGDLCEFNKRKIKPQFDKPLLYLDTGHLTEGVIEGYQTFFSAEGLPSSARRGVTEGDILFSTCRPNKRHYGFIIDPPTNLVVSTGFAVLTANYSAYRYYIYQWIKQDEIIDNIHAVAEQSSTTYPTIDVDYLGGMNIIIPSKSDIEKFAYICRDLYIKMESNYQESQRLAQLRDTLLPKLMKGEINLA